jgi:hypothetical protein
VTGNVKTILINRFSPKFIFVSVPTLYIVQNLRHFQERTGMEEPLDNRRDWRDGRTDRHQNQDGGKKCKKDMTRV